MSDAERQTAGGKVLWHFTMSLDGFVAGADHAMDWMGGFAARPGLIEEYVEATGAVLGGRDGWEIGSFVVVVDGTFHGATAIPAPLAHPSGGRRPA